MLNFLFSIDNAGHFGLVPELEACARKAPRTVQTDVTKVHVRGKIFYTACDL